MRASPASRVSAVSTPPVSGIAGFGGGIAAGGAFLAVELGARVLWSVPTLPELIQDWLVQSLPGPVFAFMLNHLLYLGKPALFSTLLCLQLVLSGLAGVAAAFLRRPIELAFVLWLVTGLLLLPVVEQGIFAERMSVVITLLVAFAAWAAALEAFWRQRPQAGAERRLLALRVVTRRDLLAGTGLLALSAILARLTIGNLPSLPPRRGRLPDPVSTPQDFYVVSKNITDPDVDAAGWTLKVDGLVDHPLTLTLAEIRAMPAQHVTRTLECISNEVGGDLISNGQFTGVRLADILQLASVRSNAQVLHFTSVDQYTENMALVKAMDLDTLLAYELDGLPLPSKHGFPLRVLGTGTYGMKNPKWLDHIELAESAPEGFWEELGWNPDAIVQTMSRIDVPQVGFVSADVVVQGIAFAGDRGISQVELSVDGGKSWDATDLMSPLGPFTWVFWTRRAILTAGAHQLRVRASDGKETQQTSRDTATYPAGATGYHRIDVHVDV